MASIKFDGTEILTSAYMPQYVKHESAPDRSLISMPLAREDGQVLIAERYGEKIITLKGTLKAASQDALDAAIDSFKELFSRVEKNLDISWNGSTRRYVATCRKHDFDRDHYHTSAVPWSAEFVVSTGVGKDTSSTTALDEHALTTDDTDTTGDFIAEDSFTLSGSKAPEPVITLEIVSVGDDDMLGIEYEDTDTGERIIVTRNVDWSAAVGKKVVIDCANKKVTDNLSSTDQVEGPFYGAFPSFKIGTNNVKIRSGGILNQTSSDQTLSDGESNIGYTATTIRYAMSFQVPYSDATFCDVVLGLSKIGTPSSALTVQIVSDSDGEPNLADVLLTGSVAAADVPSYPSFGYCRASNGAGVTLDANTTYWLVAYASSGVDGSNNYRWAIPSGTTYPRGVPLVSSDSGSNWVAGGGVPSFRILIGGFSAATELKHSVVYRKTYL